MGNSWIRENTIVSIRKVHKKQQEKMTEDVSDVENKIFCNGMDHILLKQKEGDGNGEGEQTVH